MAVKTIRLRQGENFYEFAERKFGDRSIGNTLIRQFGQGRSGVQYRFRTNLSTSKKAVAGRRSQISADFAQQQETALPEILSEGRLTRPEDIQGREAQMAGIEQRALGNVGGAVSGRPDLTELSQRSRDAEEGIRSFIKQLEFSKLSPQEQALSRQEDRQERLDKTPSNVLSFLSGKEQFISDLTSPLPGLGEAEQQPQSISQAQAEQEFQAQLNSLLGITPPPLPGAQPGGIFSGLEKGVAPVDPTDDSPFAKGLLAIYNAATSGRVSQPTGDEQDTVGAAPQFFSPGNIISNFVDRVSALPSSHPAGLNLGQVKDLAMGLIDKLLLGRAPKTIADVTARLAFGEGYADELLLAGYVWNESTGFWEFNSGVATGPGTGGTGVGGGFFAGRRGGRGGGEVARRSVGSFLPSGSNLFNWRVNFG